MKRHALAWAWLLVALAGSQPARADGYFEGVKGARAQGRAGAFVARADDLSAVQLNPAGLAHGDGTLLQLGNRFSYNAHRFERAATLDWGNTMGGVPPLVVFDEVENDTPWQLLDPLVGVASDLGLPAFRFALAAYAPPGVGRQEFPLEGGQRYMMVRRSAQIITYAASAAFAHEQLFGLGVSLQWISMPTLEYQLVIDANTFPGDANPVSSALDMLATVEGSDPFTFNAVLGAWLRPLPFLELGLSGQVIPSEIVTEGTLALDPLAPAIEDEVVLRRGTERANDVTLTLPLPVTARAGVRYIHRVDGRERFDVELDVAYAGWSAVRDFRLDSRGLVAELFAQRIAIGDIAVEKRWRDTLSLHLGGDYALIADLLTARGGVFYATPLSPPAYAHVDFVSGRQLGGALGVSVWIGALELALAFEHRHAPRFDVDEDEARVYQEVPGSQCEPPYTDPDLCHPEYLGQPAPAVNAGAYAADSSVLSLDALYRF